MTDYLDEIQARADAATDGPWTHHEFGNYGDHEPSSIVVMQGDDPGWWTRASEGEYVARLWWDSQAGADAEFIANARTDVPRLVAFAKAVMALHVPEPVPTSQHFYCEPGECDRAGEGELLDRCEVCETVYPCETVRLAGQHLGGDR